MKNKINYLRLISRRTFSFEGLKCRGNPPFRTLEDQMSRVQPAASSLFVWVGTLSKIIKVYHNRNLFNCIPNAFLCISLYFLMYSPVFSCIPLYFTVFPCILLYSLVYFLYSFAFSYILLYSSVFSCIPLYSLVFPCFPLYFLVTAIPYKLYLPTLTPYARVSRLRVENFDLTPAHACGPISHA